MAPISSARHAKVLRWSLPRFGLSARKVIELRGPPRRVYCDTRPIGNSRAREAIVTNRDIARELVELCREGRHMEAIDKHYSPDIVSVEPISHGPELPALVKGIDTVRAKNRAWEKNAQQHSLKVDGPYLGGDRFAVRFEMDVTPNATGKRVQVAEMALYTVQDGKIVREEFYYNPPPS